MLLLGDLVLADVRFHTVCRSLWSDVYRADEQPRIADEPHRIADDCRIVDADVGFPDYIDADQYRPLDILPDADAYHTIMNTAAITPPQIADLGYASTGPGWRETVERDWPAYGGWLAIYKSFVGTYAFWQPLVWILQFVVVIALEGFEPWYATRIRTCSVTTLFWRYGVCGVLLYLFNATTNWSAYRHYHAASLYAAVEWPTRVRAWIEAARAHVASAVQRRATDATEVLLRRLDEWWSTVPCATQSADLSAFVRRTLVRRWPTQSIEWWIRVRATWDETVRAVCDVACQEAWYRVIDRLRLEGQVCVVETGEQLVIDAIRMPGVTQPYESITLAAQPTFLTGRHGVGKTTLLRAIGLNVLFGRLYGIAFAARAVLPAFDALYTCINVMDVTDRDSLFQAEARQCLAWLESPAVRPLILCDELFAATNPDDAVDGGVAVIDALHATKPDTVLCVSTHFHAMIDRVDRASVLSIQLTETGTRLLCPEIDRSRSARATFAALQFPSRVIEAMPST